jgi:hypothetical protein
MFPALKVGRSAFTQSQHSGSSLLSLAEGISMHAVLQSAEARGSLYSYNRTKAKDEQNLFNGIE